MLLDVLEAVPDEEVGSHLFWLAEKLGRTPYRGACKVVALRYMPEEWKENLGYAYFLQFFIRLSIRSGDFSQTAY